MNSTLFWQSSQNSKHKISWALIFALISISLALLVLNDFRFLRLFCQLSFTKGWPFGLQITELTSRVSCHLTCHQTVWGLKGVRGYKISSLNKLSLSKGRRHLGATKSNYRTGLAMEFKTTSTCFQNQCLQANNIAWNKNRIITKRGCMFTELLGRGSSFSSKLPSIYFYRTSKFT